MVHIKKKKKVVIIKKKKKPRQDNYGFNQAMGIGVGKMEMNYKIQNRQNLMVDYCVGRHILAFTPTVRFLLKELHKWFINQEKLNLQQREPQNSVA